MFEGKAGDYPRESIFQKHYSRVGRHLASPTNIRVGWKNLARTNSLAYCEKVLYKPWPQGVHSDILRKTLG